LEIFFKKGMQSSPGLGKMHSLKLVTCCETGDIYNMYVLREFLVYHLFNVLTDSSYRVRLLAINLIDVKNRMKPVRQFGFFVEPKEILAERLQSAVVEITGLGQKHIIPGVMDRMAIFQYMVSNYDWSVKDQHNVTILQPLTNNPSGLKIAIPHDFDMTGVVNPVYGVPGAETGFNSIRDRKFLGPCRSKEIYIEELKVFRAKREEFYKIISDFPYLDVGSKKDITGFLDQFLDNFEKQNNLDNLIGIFRSSCK
jgi:hypothetical protein